MEKLKEIINEVLLNSELEAVERLESSKLLTNDLGMDSLMLAELTVRIEMEFGIDIFEDGIVTTVGEIIAKLGLNNNE